MNINNITNIISFIINRKIIQTNTHVTCFLKLLAKKSPQKFSKHKGWLFISESFALN